MRQSMNNINPMGLANPRGPMAVSQLGQSVGGNINGCFMRNPTLIDVPDFTNRGGVIHNNLGLSLLDQHITDYKIHINSEDRDPSMYPSPFKFKIPFGTTQAFSINKKFKGVKYVSLDSLILPRTIAIDTTHVTEPNMYPVNSEYSVQSVHRVPALTTLKNHKYLVLKIEELSNERNYGTDTLITNNTFILYEDGFSGIDNVLWKAYNPTVVYSSSLPFNLYSMTITLYDEFGNPITLVNQDGNNIIGTPIAGTRGEDYNTYVSNNENVQSVAYTNMVTQMFLNFSVGAIENDLNTQFAPN